jgi:hypothetical protein
MLEKTIIAATGLGYLMVGVLQLRKGAMPNAIIWLGYAFSQIGLWLALK